MYKKYYKLFLVVPSIKDNCFSALISSLSFGAGVITDLWIAGSLLRGLPTPSRGFLNRMCTQGFLLQPVSFGFLVFFQADSFLYFTWLWLPLNLTKGGQVASSLAHIFFVDDSTEILLRTHDQMHYDYKHKNKQNLGHLEAPLFLGISQTTRILRKSFPSWLSSAIRCCHRLWRNSKVIDDDSKSNQVHKVENYMTQELRDTQPGIQE